MANWAQQRRKMVDEQLRRRGIRDERVLAAFLAIPREEFVPSGMRDLSYSDSPVGIGQEQTISQPYIAALMTQVLDLGGDEIVLEVGAGSGYEAAVLGRLARRVVSIEIVPELAAQARRNLEKTGCGDNVLVMQGDGSAGYPPESPYDAIAVAAAAPEVPAPLLEQLADPGILVIPVGALDDQDLRVITKRNGAISTAVATMCRFVPLRGVRGWE